MDSARPHPLVSVVVPTKDRPVLLREALASIAQQTLTDVEVVVVNDAGCDVGEVVAESPLAVTLVVHETNRGLAAARNTGLRAATGKYVAYLDDDDLFLPNHLETLVGRLESAPESVAYADGYVAATQPDGSVRRELRQAPDFSRDRFLYENSIPVLSVVHERACLDDTGLFDEDLSTPLEDWDLWIRLSQRYDFVHVPVATWEVREHASAARISTDRWPFFRNAERIFAKYAHLVAGRPDLRRLQLGYLAGLRLLDCSAGVPRVSIVIPTFNNLELTRACLARLAETTPRGLHEVIVVDNASTDDTPLFLRAEQDAGRLTAVLNEENLGFARACNQGAERARGDLVLFLNNDTLPHHGWLEALVVAFDADGRVGVAGSKLLYEDGTIQHAGVVVGLHDGDPFPYHAYLCHPADAPHVSRPRELQMVTGACLAIRRSLHQRLGGFDEAYWNGHEDLDLCLRAREAGFAVVYRPDSVVTHLESRTKRLLGLEQFHYDKDADNEEMRGRRRFLARWGASIEIDHERIYAEDREAAEPLHVLFTMFGWADDGGGTILPRQVAKALVRAGHRVTVIFTPSQDAPGKPAYWVEEGEDEGVRLLAIYNRPARFLDQTNPERDADDPEMRAVVRRLVADAAPDVVHYHSLVGFSLRTPEDLSAAGLPSVYTSHNYFPLCPNMYLFDKDLSLCGGPSDDGAKCGKCLGRPDKAAGYAERLRRGREALNGHVDRHLAVSTRVRELFTANGHDAERIHVLRQEAESVDWLWDRVGRDRIPVETLGRPLRVGYIGSLAPQKGVRNLLDALQAMPEGTVEGHFFGGGAERYVESLRALDKKGVIRFHGAYEPRALPELLASVDVVAVPSVWEDCAPLVVAEALAARAPVVASRIGGIPDFVRDGVDGILVPPRDVDALAGALASFVDDPGLLGRMQAAIVPPRGFRSYLGELVGHYRAVIAERAERGQGRVDGARGFAALAFADEIVADPSLLAAFGRAFGADDDATLVLYAPGLGENGLAAALGDAVAAAGLDHEDAPDLLALAVAADEPLVEQVAVARRVDAVLTARRPEGPFAGPPAFDAGGVADLRALAEDRWAA